MIISHKHKFIFFHIPKAAGSSVFLSLCNAINALDDDLRPRCSDKDHLLVKNPPYNSFGNCDTINQHSSFNDVQDFFKLNGWDINVYFKFSFVRNPWARSVSYYFYLFHNSMNFREHCIKNQDLQYNWLQCDESKDVAVDFVGKVETAQQDLDFIFENIGLPKQQLPHRNKSTHKHKHYTEYYDNETRHIIAEKYAKDIDYFGYEFKK